MTQLLLTPGEARVLASLAEKAITTPQYYPMTVNAIMLAANQKSSRDPLMKLTEGDVGAALNRLRELDLVRPDDSVGRVTKWRHQFKHHLLLDPALFALVVTLMLRGPQTVAELRANAAVLGGPDDDAAVRTALASLADRAQPLVVQLPRAAGQKEGRYGHTLSGAPVMPEREPEAPAPPRADALAALEERLRQLEDRVAALENPPSP